MKKEYLLFLSKGETISGPLNLFSIVIISIFLNWISPFQRNSLFLSPQPKSIFIIDMFFLFLILFWSLQLNLLNKYVFFIISMYSIGNLPSTFISSKLFFWVLTLEPIVFLFKYICGIILSPVNAKVLLSFIDLNIEFLFLDLTKTPNLPWP